MIELYKEGYRGFISGVYSTRGLYYILYGAKGLINKATFSLDIVKKYNTATNRELDCIIEVAGLFSRSSIGISTGIGGSKRKYGLIEVPETAIIELLYLVLSR